jgi:hypothetical protein
MVANLRVEDWHVLHQQLRKIAKQRAALDAEEARYLREAEAIRLWRRLGYVHMGEYLERELGYGPHAGAERLRVARELGGLPQIEAKLTDGTLLYSAVRELTRIATPATEAAWIEAARGKNLRQIEALVSGHKQGDLPDDPTSPELIHRVVRLELSPQAFALFRQVQSALADQHGGQLDDSALIEAMCRRALEGDAASERPAHQIAITVCASCGRGWQTGAGHEIEIGPKAIERARCDAEWIGSLEDTEPARVTATVTPRLRRQVLARDRHHCAVPGCRSARNLDLHHIEYQRDGGSHELANLLTICSGHHQLLHDGALTITGKAPDALEFVWRDNDPREPDPEPRTAPTPGAANPGRGPVTRQDAQRPMSVATAPTPGAANPDRAPVACAAAELQRAAQQALTTAGYKPQEARAAVARAWSHGGPAVGLEGLIREALRQCRTPEHG